MASVYSLHSILYTCHAANTHSLIHMNVCSATTAAATRIKTITNAFYHSVSTKQPTTSHFNVIEYSEIVCDNNCTRLQIGAHFGAKKSRVLQCTWRVRETTLIFCVHLCLRLSAKVQPLCVSQTIVNNFSSAWIEDQYTPLTH